MTLTDASALTKKVLIFSAIFFTIILFAWIGIWYYFAKVYVPPQVVEKPTLAFDALPKLTIHKSADSSKFNYTPDTETGTFSGKFPYLFKVYSIAQLSTDLLALEKAKDLARTMGFKNNPELLNPTEYKFLSENGGDLTIKLGTGNFKMHRPIATESADLEDKEIFLNQEKTADTFKGYLGGKGLLDNLLKDGRAKVVYDKSGSETSKAIVNLWQQDIDKIPIVTDTFTDALVNGMVTNYREEQKKFVRIDYTYWPIDLDHFATYPIKTVEQAYKDLETGNAMVPVSSKNLQVSITKVYLAYFLPEEYTPILQPVYVFEGPDFTAYIQAVKSDYIKKE